MGVGTVQHFSSFVVVFSDESYMRTAIETMEELDWCLDQLETIQTHRSVSDMATSKVRKERGQKFVVDWQVGTVRWMDLAILLPTH